MNKPDYTLDRDDEIVYSV